MLRNLARLSVRRVPTASLAAPIAPCGVAFGNNAPNVFSITQAQRRLASTGSSTKANDDDDDFVDIMFPGEDLSSDVSGAGGGGLTSSSAAVAPLGAEADDDIVLGIQRDEPLREGEEITRLGVRRMKTGQEARMNTRAASLQGDANSNSSLVRASGGNGDDFDEIDDDEEDGYELAEGEEPPTDDDEFTPDEDLKGIELPYDDEQFAEAILQMEVEGQLDESWQNGRTAKKEDCAAIVDILRHMKARDLCCIDVSSKTSSFDYMIFATCEGPRHVHLCSWSVSKADKEHRLTKPKRKTSDRTWEAVPVGRIIVNLMTENYRNEVNFERKWAVTKTMDPLDHANASVGEGRVVKAHGLWTLTLNLQDLEDFEVDYCKDALLAQL